jgi:hypothetical protein
VALDRTLHFYVEAEVRSQKVGTDQEKYDLRRFEMSLNLSTPFNSGPDVSIMPVTDHALTLQQTQVLE